MLIYEYVRELRDGEDRWDNLKSKINKTWREKGVIQNICGTHYMWSYTVLNRP